MAKLLDYDFRHYGCERKIIVVPESIGMGESYYINEPFYGANAASRTQTIYMGTAINYAPCSIYGFSIYFSKKPHST